MTDFVCRNLFGVRSCCAAPFLRGHPNKIRSSFCFCRGVSPAKNKKATGDNLVVGIVHDGYPCRLAREVATRKGRQNKGSSPLVSLVCVINWVTVMTGACLCSVFVVIILVYFFDTCQVRLLFLLDETD